MSSSLRNEMFIMVMVGFLVRDKMLFRKNPETHISYRYKYILRFEILRRWVSMIMRKVRDYSRTTQEETTISIIDFIIRGQTSNNELLHCL